MLASQELMQGEISLDLLKKCAEQLGAELARVREQRDILKKTLGILSEPSKNATTALKP